MRQRRIGTITLGISLVVFGILFLIHIFGGVLNYMLSGGGVKRRPAGR